MNKPECIEVLDSLIIHASQAEQTEGLKRKIKALKYARECVERIDE